MAKFLVHYSYPQQFGDFIIDAVDWLEADKILKSYLEAKGCTGKSTHATVVELNEKITILGEGIK